MIMRWKGQLTSGKVSDQVFAAWLMPAILELCGENLPGGGRSFSQANPPRVTL